MTSNNPSSKPQQAAQRSQTKRLAVLAVLALFVTAIAGAAAITTSSDTTKANAQALNWGPCDDGAAGWQCASLAVPIDYTRPDGASINLALTRMPAGDPARRIGPLLLNFGGPGGEAVSTVHEMGAFIFSDEMRARFDLVGFDPRGVGGSAGLDCKIDVEAYYSIDTSPDTDAERQAQIDAGRRLAEGCKANGGALLPFMGTDNVVKDLERIRMALGVERFSFWGPSYGTSIAVQYGEEYPSHVRAFSIEDVLATDVDGATLFKEVAISYEWSFNAFLDDCAANPECAFYSNGKPHAAYDALMARLDRQPLYAPGNPRPVTQSDVLGMVDRGLWGMKNWPEIAEALQLAADGDGATLRQVLDKVSGRHEDGTYEAPKSFYAFVAVHCLDNSFPRDLQSLQKLSADVMQLAPRTGAVYMNVGYACLSWPAPHRETPAHPKGRDLPPILVVGATLDMQTPYVQAVRLAQQLPTSVLLTRDGPGHTSYWLSECVQKAVDTYYIDLKLPAPGTHCPSTGGLFSKS